jgi:hypothetical protein
MRARDRAIALEQIADIRLLQRQAAQGAVARMQALICQLQERRDALLGQIQQQQQSWRAALQSKSMDLGVAAAWSAKIRQGQIDLDAIAQELRIAQDQLTHEQARLRDAISRSDVAKDVSRSADRALHRQLEEASLHGLAELFLSRQALP